MGKKTVRGHDIANRFVYSLKGAITGTFIKNRHIGGYEYPQCATPSLFHCTGR
jgi:hypothetical protein